MVKLKKGQQQSQYQQDYPEDFGAIVANKAKSLGKKNHAPMSSIREKATQKNIIKALKSSFNQAEPHRKA